MTPLVRLMKTKEVRKQKFEDLCKNFMLMM